jgi:hypothetical protein
MVLTAAHSVHALLLKLQLHLGPYETHTDTHVYIYIYIYTCRLSFQLKMTHLDSGSIELASLAS